MLLLPALCVPGAPASAQQASGNEPARYAAASGDAWVDRHLADINHYAERYPDSFADELARYYAAPRAYVLAMLQQPDWTAGDVFLACALARRKAQPCRVLVRARAGNADQDWEAAARQVEARVTVDGAGADDDVRDVREDIRASYLRWARPLLD